MNVTGYIIDQDSCKTVNRLVQGVDIERKFHVYFRIAVLLNYFKSVTLGFKCLNYEGCLHEDALSTAAQNIK